MHQLAGYEELKVTDVFHKDTLNAQRLLTAGAILCPIGRYYNRDLQVLRKGDIIKFIDEKPHYGRVIELAILPMKAMFFEAIMHFIYGDNCTREILLHRWRDHAAVLGNGPSVISDQYCLMLRYERYTPNEEKNAKKRDIHS